MATLGYIGCKHRLLGAVDEVLRKNVHADRLPGCVLLDLFSGTAAVGTFANRTYKCRVLATDCEAFAETIARATLTCPYTPKLAALVDAMNALPPEDGPLALELSEKRMFFTPENGRILQAARSFVDRLTPAELDGPERAFLVASILSSADRVANTASVYGSYLKHYKTVAKRRLSIAPVHTSADVPHAATNVVCCADANAFVERDLAGLLERIASEPSTSVAAANGTVVAFVDCPYNHRNYSSYYSPLNVIAKNDTHNLRGIGAMMPDGYSSDFSSKRRALAAFRRLVQGLVAVRAVDHVFVTYGLYGIMTEDDITTALAQFGTVKKYGVGVKKFVSDTGVDAGTVAERWFFVTRSQDIGSSGSTM